jgi:hypothetical protein
MAVALGINGFVIGKTSLKGASGFEPPGRKFTSK